MFEAVKQLLAQPYNHAILQTTPQNYPDAQGSPVTAYYNESVFLEENLNDRRINRQQREEIARKTFSMMSVELIVTACFISGIFIVPFLNAKVPEIIINLPPIFLSITILITFLYIHKKINLIPNIRCSNKNFHLKKTSVNIREFIKIFLLVSVMILFNNLPRTSYIIHFNYIIMDNEIIYMVFAVALGVFTKTTILGKDIIKNLYELMKNHNLN